MKRQEKAQRKEQPPNQERNIPAEEVRARRMSLRAEMLRDKKEARAESILKMTPEELQRAKEAANVECTRKQQQRLWEQWQKQEP